MSINPGAWAAAQLDPSEICMDNFDEKTRKALEGFEKAVRPAGLAVSGASGETIRSRAEKLLKVECRVLVNAGEALLSAVGRELNSPVMVLLLQKLPKLLARQALMVALSDVTPELLDRQWLRTQVDDLRTKQVASTTTYLQELGTLRSHLRQVAAAESHLRAVAAETPTPTPSQSKRGSKTDPSSQNSQRRPSVLKKPSKNSVPADRRASFSETAEEIAIPQKMGRQPTATDGEPPKTSLSGSASGGPHGRKGRKFSTMTGAATAAMAFARAQGFGSNAPSEHDVAEVGIEFAEVHHYMWDAAEFLDQATQTLVCKVITEKLRCFKTQKEATTIAELAHLCRRMESYLKGTALEDHEKELKEVRMKLYAREEEASSLVERLQVETAQYEQKERSYIGKLQQQERLRDSLQRELVDTQAQLAAMTAKSQELANELTVYKDAEASMKKQSAAFAKSRGRILNVQKSSEDGSESSLEDFFARMLPDLVQHLTKEMKDQSLKNQFTPIVKSLHQIWKSSRAKSQKTAAALEDAEREAAEGSKKLEELEGARQKEKDAADAKVQSMKDRAEHAEKNLVELQSNFMDNLRQAPAYVSLREDYEICRCELEQTIKQLRAVQEEYEEKFAEHEAGWAKQAEDHRAQVQKLQNDLREVVESQLHPAQVAQLRADLKRAQHESQALTNTNNMLKDSLAALQKKLMEAESERRRSAATGIKEEVRLLRDTCSRTVFSRLYEDAVRRSDVDQSDDAPPHARSWAGSILELRSRPHSANNAAATPRPLSAQSASTPRRALSEPPVRIVSPTALHEMQRQNAMHLQHTLRESLFQHPFRLPLSPCMPANPRNLAGNFGDQSASPRSRCVTPTMANVDMQELSMAAESAVGQGNSPPRRRRSSPLPSPSVSIKTPRSPISEDAVGQRKANATPDNFGTETPRAEKLKPLSRPPTPDKTPRRRLIEGGPEKPQQLQPLHERSQAEAEEPKEETEPAGKVPPKPWSPRMPAKSRQGPPNDSPTGRLSPPSTDRASPETFPRPLPRMAATLLPSVRPKSAKPVQKAVAFNCSTPRPMTCGV